MDDPARRPLKSRDTALARRIARRLANSSVTPNQISAVSIVFAALAGLAFWMSAMVEPPWRGPWLVVAALGVQMRLLCNLFDGMVALEGGKKSPTGDFWNEAPDRLSDITILVGLGLGAGAPALGWAAAALAVLTAYIRELGRASGLAPDFCGPMAKPHRMAVATCAALVAIVAAPAGIDVLVPALWIIAAGSGATALRRSVRLLAELRARPG